MMQEIEIVPLVSYISSVNSRYTYCSHAKVIIMTSLFYHIYDLMYEKEIFSQCIICNNVKIHVSVINL